MSVRFKVFKPAMLQASVFQDAFVDSAKQMASDVHDDFDAITENWRHAVPFEETVNKGNGAINISVMTDDLGFKYYDQGNGGPGAIIRPVNAKALHWINKEGQDVFRKYVHGYEGKFAVQRLEKLWADKAPVYFQVAMREAAKNSGNSI